MTYTSVETWDKIAGQVKVKPGETDEVETKSEERRVNRQGQQPPSATKNERAEKSSRQPAGAFAALNILGFQLGWKASCQQNLAFNFRSLSIFNGAAKERAVLVHLVCVWFPVSGDSICLFRGISTLIVGANQDLSAGKNRRYNSK